MPDFDKVAKREISPEEHLKANSVLSLMTAIVSLSLAILLYVLFLGKDDTPVIIYITAGFLTAMCAWQVQTFWRTLKLKKQIVNKNNRPEVSEKYEDKKTLSPAPTKEFLNEADLSHIVPASVTEYTTKNLTEKKGGKSS